MRVARSGAKGGSEKRIGINPGVALRAAPTSSALGGVAIGTLVERGTKSKMLLHLPPVDGHTKAGTQLRNGPATAGHGAEAVRDAIAHSMSCLPGMLCKSLTWDQGGVLAQHAQLRINANLPVYFYDPHSPWRRPGNRNTNGLLRHYFQLVE